MFGLIDRRIYPILLDPKLYYFFNILSIVDN